MLKTSSKQTKTVEKFPEPIECNWVPPAPVKKPPGALLLLCHSGGLGRNFNERIA